ncbi:hypothetical protein PV328_001038 [Microctonus aethiopoides]|uniref:Uncharacterized protein n=1 Tax=Microctonus aethiopoides TaxID=144406 RepID=A0AA39FW36_9HYME|nr:hypothetical protein PV328_001038 [Microctonus aethiopoides]
MSEHCGQAEDNPDQHHQLPCDNLSRISESGSIDEYWKTTVNNPMNNAKQSSGQQHVHLSKYTMKTNPIEVIAGLRKETWRMGRTRQQRAVTTSSSSMEDMLKKFMEQQSTFNKNMTDSMTQQTQALKRQAKVQDDMNIKMNEIKKIVNPLNEPEIAALSNDNQKLSSEVCLLKQSDTINTSKLSSKIIISGVPQTVSNNPLTAISKILHSIDASHQVEDILDIRSVNKKHDNTTSTLPAEIKSTFIINFKSPQIASHVVDKKRRYGVLTTKRPKGILLNNFMQSFNTYYPHYKNITLAGDLNCNLLAQGFEALTIL